MAKKNGDGKADVKKLFEFAREIAPLIEDVFKEAAKGQAGSDYPPLTKAIDKLRQLVEGGTGSVAGEAEARLRALYAAQEVMDEIYRSAVGAQVALPPDMVRDLEDAYDTLMLAKHASEVLTAFKDVPMLLPMLEVERIKTLLVAGAAEVKEKKTAQAALNVTVTAVIVASKIAVKVVGF